MTCVYILVDPRSGLPFYVGMSDDPHHRMQAHLTHDCVSSTRFVKDIQDAGRTPRLKIIAYDLDRKAASLAEQRVIRELRRRRIPIANNSFGAIGPFRQFQRNAAYSINPYDAPILPADACSTPKPRARNAAALQTATD